jgi:hypothetical protein
MLFDLELNKAVYKPLILNNTNAKFCQQEFKSPFMEDWLDKPCVLYAMPDKRFEFVARLKKYYPPQVSDKNAIAVLSASKTLDELKTNWGKITVAEQALPTVLALKDKLKNTLQ